MSFSIKEFKERLHILYKLANETMHTRQEKYLNYQDKKVCDDVLPLNCLVYLYLPRKRRDKMEGYQVDRAVLSVKHPIYHIEYRNGTTWNKPAWLSVARQDGIRPLTFMRN